MSRLGVCADATPVVNVEKTNANAYVIRRLEQKETDQPKSADTNPLKTSTDVKNSEEASNKG